MIKSLNEYNQIVMIEGLFSKKSKNYDELIKTLRRKSSILIIQLLDSKLILGYNHILFAVLNALKAKKNKKMISENLLMEILVYASAQRQINKSIDMLGVKKTSNRIVLVALSKSESRLHDLKNSILKMQDLSLDNSFFSIWNEEIAKKIRTIYKISKSEFNSVKRENYSDRKALEEIIIEKMALLSLS